MERASWREEESDKDWEMVDLLKNRKNAIDMLIGLRKEQKKNAANIEKQITLEMV